MEYVKYLIGRRKIQLRQIVGEWKEHCAVTKNKNKKAIELERKHKTNLNKKGGSKTNLQNKTKQNNHTS